MITFLNDRDWQLRAAFFHHICDMGSYAGSEGLQAFLLPCLEQVCCFLASVCVASSMIAASTSSPACKRLLLCQIPQRLIGGWSLSCYKQAPACCNGSLCIFGRLLSSRFCRQAQLTDARVGLLSGAHMCAEPPSQIAFFSTAVGVGRC